MGTELKGAFAEIDTKEDLEAIQILRSGSEEERVRVAEEIAANSENYSPAVFFALATAHFAAGRTPVALFWLFAGRVRLWFDIQRCTDNSVQSAAEMLGNSTPELLRLAQFEDIEESRKILARAVEWDRDTQHNYDPCWIALHGLGPSLPGAENVTRESLTIPEDQWDALAKKNRDDYYANYVTETHAMDETQLKQIKDKIAELRSR